MENMKKIEAKNSSNYKSPAAVAADPVILTVIDGKLSVLLVASGDKYMLPGGFVDSVESPEETAARKLFEKTGVENVYLEQLKTYGDPDRDPRGWIISVAFLSLIDSHKLPDDSSGVWFPVDDMHDLAFDHADMIDEAVQRLRGKLWYSNVAVGLLPEEFTIGQARRVYQAISGVEYDPSNFDRDLDSLGLVEETGNTISTGKGRPGKGLRFRNRNATWGGGYARRTAGEAR